MQTNATGIQLGMDGSLDGGIVSAIHSLFFNIDSDNNSSGQQIRFATNHSGGASGGNTLLSIQEDGRGLSQFTAKVWANFNQNTATILDSHNVGSLTDSGLGDFTVNFANNLASANYAAAGNSMASSGCDVAHDTTSVSAIGYRTYRATDGSAVEKDAAGLIIFGD